MSLGDEVSSRPLSGAGTQDRVRETYPRAFALEMYPTTLDVQDKRVQQNKGKRLTITRHRDTGGCHADS